MEDCADTDTERTVSVPWVKQNIKQNSAAHDLQAVGMQNVIR